MVMRTVLRWAVTSLALIVLTGVAYAASDSESAWLGVFMQDLDPELREALDYRGEGVLVNRVVDGSPADRAGIRKGDVIERIDGRLITSTDALSREVRAHRAGETVTVRVFRDGDTHTYQVELGDRADSESGDLGRRRSAIERKEKTEKGDDQGEGNHFHFETPAPPATPDPDAIRRMVDRSPMRMQMLRGMAGRGRLGVRVEDLNSDLNDVFDVPGGKGVVVMEVLEGTPAQRAGLRAGDVITSLDGEGIGDSSELVSALRSHEGRVRLDIVRRGERRTVEVDLGSGSRTNDEGIETRRELRRMRSAPDSDELRGELRDLRRQIEELRDELENLKRR